MLGAQLRAAFTKAAPGRCAFCRRAIRSGAKCRRPRCRRAYARLWARDNRASRTIRRVVRRTPSPTSARRRTDWLTCGHSVEVRASAPKAKRRHCPTCPLLERN